MVSSHFLPFTVPSSPSSAPFPGCAQPLCKGPQKRACSQLTSTDVKPQLVAVVKVAGQEHVQWSDSRCPKIADSLHGLPLSKPAIFKPTGSVLRLLILDTSASKSHQIFGFGAVARLAAIARSVEREGVTFLIL